MSTALKSTEYIRAKTLAAKLDCGESTVWRMVQNGLLPQPSVRIGKRTTLWNWGAVVAFLEQQPQGGDAA